MLRVCACVYVCVHAHTHIHTHTYTHTQLCACERGGVVYVHMHMHTSFTVFKSPVYVHFYVVHIVTINLWEIDATGCVSVCLLCVINPHNPFIANNRLDGLVVKASALRAEIPGFESCLRQDFSGPSHTVTQKLALQWLPCQAPGITGSALGLVGPVSVYCDWVR